MQRREKRIAVEGFIGEQSHPNAGFYVMGRGTAHTVMFYVILNMSETCAKNRNVCFARQKCVAFVLRSYTFPGICTGKEQGLAYYVNMTISREDNENVRAYICKGSTHSEILGTLTIWEEAKDDFILK